MSINQHFDFADWTEAFAAFYEAKAKDDSISLVMETELYVSGYWIESLPPRGDGDFVYTTIEEVQALEGRIRAAIAEKERDGNKYYSLGRLIT